MRWMTFVFCGLLFGTVQAAPITFTHTAGVDSATIDGIGYTNLTLETTVYADDSVLSNGSGEWFPVGGWEFGFNFIGVKDLGRSTSHNVVKITQAAGIFLADISGSGTGITIVSGIDWTDINVLGSLVTNPDSGLMGTGSFAGRFTPSGTFENGTASNVILTEGGTASLQVGASSTIPSPLPFILFISGLILLIAKTHHEARSFGE